MDDIEIIGLLGNQGVGKNYIAENIIPKLLNNKRYVVLAFGDLLKIDLITKNNISYSEVFENKTHKTRLLLQQLASLEKEKYGDNIFIEKLDSLIRVLRDRCIERFIISDVRFQNEIDWINSLNGVVIKINAKNRFLDRLIKENGNDDEKIKKIISHDSEKNINMVKGWKYEVYNNDGDNIEEQLFNIFR